MFGAITTLNETEFQYRQLYSHSYPRGMDFFLSAWLPYRRSGDLMIFAKLLSRADGMSQAIWGVRCARFLKPSEVGDQQSFE